MERTARRPGRPRERRSKRPLRSTRTPNGRRRTAVPRCHTPRGWAHRVGSSVRSDAVSHTARVPTHGALAVVLIAVFLGALFLGVAVGSVPIGLHDLLGALTGHADPTTRAIIHDLRLPRAIGAALLGAA